MEFSVSGGIIMQSMEMCFDDFSDLGDSTPSTKEGEMSPDVYMSDGTFSLPPFNPPHPSPTPSINSTPQFHFDQLSHPTYTFSPQPPPVPSTMPSPPFGTIRLWLDSLTKTPYHAKLQLYQGTQKKTLHSFLPHDEITTGIFHCVGGEELTIATLDEISTSTLLSCPNFHSDFYQGSAMGTEYVREFVQNLRLGRHPQVGHLFGPRPIVELASIPSPTLASDMKKYTGWICMEKSFQRGQGDVYKGQLDVMTGAVGHIKGVLTQGKRSTEIFSIPGIKPMYEMFQAENSYNVGPCDPPEAERIFAQASFGGGSALKAVVEKLKVCGAPQLFLQLLRDWLWKLKGERDKPIEAPSEVHGEVRAERVNWAGGVQLKLIQNGSWVTLMDSREVLRLSEALGEGEESKRLASLDPVVTHRVFEEAALSGRTSLTVVSEAYQRMVFSLEESIRYLRWGILEVRGEVQPKCPIQEGGQRPNQIEFTNGTASSPQGQLSAAVPSRNQFQFTNGGSGGSQGLISAAALVQNQIQYSNPQTLPPYRAPTSPANGQILTPRPPQAQPHRMTAPSGTFPQNQIRPPPPYDLISPRPTPPAQHPGVPPHGELRIVRVSERDIELHLAKGPFYQFLFYLQPNPWVFQILPTNGATVRLVSFEPTLTEMAWQKINSSQGTEAIRTLGQLFKQCRNEHETTQALKTWLGVTSFMFHLGQAPSPQGPFTPKACPSPQSNSQSPLGSIPEHRVSPCNNATTSSDTSPGSFTFDPTTIMTSPSSESNHSPKSNSTTTAIAQQQLSPTHSMVDSPKPEVPSNSIDQFKTWDGEMADEKCLSKWHLDEKMTSDSFPMSPLDELLKPVGTFIPTPQTFDDIKEELFQSQDCPFSTSNSPSNIKKEMSPKLNEDSREERDRSSIGPSSPNAIGGICIKLEDKHER